MGEYKTISVPEKVKRRLEGAKGDKEWGEFLLGLYGEIKRLKGERAFETLSEELSEEELGDILESSKEFREKFELR